MLVLWIPTPMGDGWDLEPDPVVWLNVTKVEASFRRNVEHYVGASGGGAGQRSRYDNVGRFIRSGHPVFMPHLSINKDGLITFTDGRHRFAWVRDHGAVAVPATTNDQSVPELEVLFGTPLRECRVKS